MNGEYAIDEERLRGQAEYFEIEKNLCQELYSHIMRAKRRSEISRDSSYTKQLEKIEALSDFFQAMSSISCEIADKIKAHIVSTNDVLEDNAAEVSRILQFEFFD